MIEFEEKTYTEDEVRAMFKAIYEGKINHIDIFERADIISFNVAPVVYCGECDHCRKDGYCTRHHLKERDKKWFCGDGRKRTEGHHHDVKIEGGKVSACDS